MDREILRRFQRDIRGHEMTVSLDQGLHRHLTFAQPGTNNMRFHITTWPGYLAFTGDMGAYTFSRLADMFEFFRPDYNRHHFSSIEFSYLAEKCIAGDKSSRGNGVKEFSEDAYNDACRSVLNSHISGMPFSQAKEIFLDAQEELFGYPDNEYDAYSRAVGWKCPVTDTHPFQDFWEHDLREFTYRFKWCCTALRWAIHQYDLIKAGQDTASQQQLILKGAI